MAVWAVHTIRDVDTSQASVYGELSYINGRYIYSDEIEKGGLPEKFLSNLERAVDQFEPDHDFVLIAGDHLQLIAFSAMLSARWGRFKVLRFDRQAGGYFPVTIIGEGNFEPRPVQ